MHVTLSQQISNFKSLVANNVNAIRLAANHSWCHINLNQREPSIIHDYFIGKNGSGIPILNQFIAPLFLPDGYEVKFAGVFCHGHPQVTPMQGQVHANTRSRMVSDCELGDLHLVFAFLDQQKNLRNQRAILFQAKKKPKKGTLDRIDNDNQACLYERADSFDYTTLLAGQSRNMPIGRAREKALHYLFCGKHPVTTSSATAPARMDFGELLLRFMLDSEGLFFEPSTANGYRRWSHINRDLLGEVSKATAQGARRGDISSLLSHFNDFTDPTEFFLSKDGGVSTLLVIVKDTKLPA